MFLKLSLFSVVSVLAAQPSMAMSLSDALANGGKLQVVTTQTVSGTDRDGDPAYIQQVVYQGNYSSVLPKAANDPTDIDLGKMSCMGVFSTEGQTLVVPAGTELEWNTDELAGDRFEIFSDGDTTYEEMRILFYGDNSLFTEMDCSIEVKTGDPLPTLTVEDFEKATGGQMKLVPQN